MTVTAINNRVSSNIQTEVIIYDHMDRNMSTVVCDAVRTVEVEQEKKQ